MTEELRSPDRWTVLAVALSTLVIGYLGHNVGWYFAEQADCGDAPQPGCGPSTGSVVGWGIAWLLVVVAVPTWIQWRHVHRRGTRVA